MKNRKSNTISFFVIILLPLIMMTTAAAGAFLLFRTRIETTYGIPIRALPPETKDLIFAVIVLIAAVLFLIGLVFSLWLYKSVTEPLQKLCRATRLIRDGEMDFEITEEGPDEIRELCRDFESMRVKLKEASEAQVEYDRDNKELISNISHDLRTPIASVKGYALGIMEGVADTPEKVDHYVRTIYNKANEMDHLIGELSFYSRIDTNRMPYAFARVDAHAFFDDAAEEMELELSGEGVEFTYTNTVEEGVRFIADSEQIRRVMNNIISNSLKYMDKPEKAMSLSVTDTGDFICAAIRDNGCGIAKADLANIFNRFYRTDSSRHSGTGGSGIGLSIVKKIIEDHGGRAWAASTQGEDTTIFFELRKYVDPELAADEADEAEHAEKKQAVRRGEKERRSGDRDRRNKGKKAENERR